MQTYSIENNLLNSISVDIVLPNYNSDLFLEETLDSIIKQTFPNWKLFIVDGNSNTETQKILEKYNNHPKINITRLKKNKRAGFCRNLAIRKSKSDYVSFIDSDDLWEKNKILGNGIKSFRIDCQKLQSDEYNLGDGYDKTKKKKRKK